MSVGKKVKREFYERDEDEELLEVWRKNAQARPRDKNGRWQADPKPVTPPAEIIDMDDDSDRAVHLLLGIPVT